MPYIEGRIVYVDPLRLVCDAIGIDGINLYEDVQYTNKGLKQSGDILHPEIGDVIIVELAEHGQKYLYKYYGQRTTTTKNLMAIQVGRGGNPNLNTNFPGDHVLTGPDGAWLSLLRGGLAGMGSSPLCQTLYLGLESLIRSVCQSYDVISAGSRIFSINTDNGIVTRLCFSGSDQLTADGYNNNPDATSENFEYQIDITSDAMTFFIGEIDDTTGKRVNNLTISLKPTGDVEFTCGPFIQGGLYSSGSFDIQMVDSGGKILYNKSVANNSLTHTDGGDKVLVKEVIDGNVIRTVTGDVYEMIKGTLEQNLNVHRKTVTINDLSTTINKVTAGFNMDSIQATPNAGIN